MKYKNCRNLNSQIDWFSGVKFPWCYEIDDSPDIEIERKCNKYSGKTNADKIRRMSDKELSEFLLKVIDSYDSPCMIGEVDCTWEDYPTHDKGCKDCFLEWLQKEVE